MKSSRYQLSTWAAHTPQRPVVRFGLLLGAIFLAELVAHQLQFDVTWGAGALIDALFLTFITSIITWPLIIKPLRDALKTEQAMAQMILDSTVDAIITIDEYGIIQMQNRAARKMFGFSEKDAIGRNVNTIVAPPHQERHDRYLENFRRTGVKNVIGTTRQLEAVRAGGEVFPVELSVSEVWAGGRRFFSATIRDITERKHTEERLKKLSNAVEQSPAATVITDVHGHIDYVNPRFSEISGYSPEELIGKKPDMIKSGLTPPAVYEDLWRTILSGREWHGEMQNRKKSGELYWEREIISSVKNDRGEIVNFIAVKEDITARRRAEESLLQERVRLLETERELRQAQHSLADAARLEAVGRLAAGIAHEVKNPLMIIRLGIDYLFTQSSLATNQQVFDDVRGAITRADRVIGDMLDFSRQKPFHPRPTAINEVIDNAIRLTMHETARRGVEIVGKYENPMPPILGDADRLIQVFINLLANAAQAIGQDGRIEIVTRSICLSEHELERSDRSLFKLGDPVITVDILDDGPGFSADAETKLFDPFFTTKPLGEGTGLGLAVSRNIVIMHGGSISISNRLGRGASAYLVFHVDKGPSGDEKANTGR